MDESYDSLKMHTPPSSRRLFPDKKKDNNRNGRYKLQTPTGRPSAQMLAQRMRSISGYSSGEESPSSFRRVTRFGGADSSNVVQFVVSTPKGSRSKEIDDIWQPPSRDVLIEMSKEASSDEKRPPSPRPLDSREKFMEHNKQLHIWDDWLTTASPAEDNDLASARYRRTASRNVPKAFGFPKILEFDSSDESDE